MKVLLTLIIAVSLLGVATLSILDMGHNNGAEEHGDCLAANAQGLACPQNVSPFESVGFHFSAFREITLASIPQNGLVQILLLVFLTTLAWLASLYYYYREALLFPFLKLAFQRLRLPPIARQPLAYWLALHETSPTFF